jgi:hypothetical protein
MRLYRKGELTPQQFADWTRDHVAFVAEPRRPYCFDVMEFDNPYVDEPTFNEEKFIDDLTQYIRSEVGEGVTIKYRSGCCEFEIYREQSTEKNS